MVMVLALNRVRFDVSQYYAKKQFLFIYYNQLLLETLYTVCLPQGIMETSINRGNR
jgi:hypothetical protein